VWICEADDYAETGFLNACVRQFSDPEVVLAYAQSAQIGESGEVLAPDYLAYTHDISETRWSQDYQLDGMDEIAEVLAVKNTIPNVSAVLFRRDELQDALVQFHGMLTNMKVAGDWLIYSHVLQQGKVAFVAKSLNNHRRHNDSVTISSENRYRHMAEILFMQARLMASASPAERTRTLAKEFADHAFRYLGLAGDGAKDAASHPRVQHWLQVLEKDTDR
jgi:hypothetical protein